MRKIIHIDMDCFYAAIEIRDQPELKDKAVAVGGAADRRGVLTTCNYEARRFGVHSAMPAFLALRKCPQLIILPTRFELYREESRRIRKIFGNFARLVEPLSLDEAYLDVSEDKRSGWEIAKAIRAEIFETTGLTASAGIGPNKLIAKIASDWEKPDGQFEVKAEDVEAFMKPLPVGRIWGVGPVAAERFRHRGIQTCEDLHRMDTAVLLKMFGRFGGELYELSRGIDRRPVEPFRPRKSMSTERTFSTNLDGIEECRPQLHQLFDELVEDLKNRTERRPVERLFVKITFYDFLRTSVERSGREPLLSVYEALLEEGILRGGKAVRLIGVGVRFSEQAVEQLELPLIWS